MVARSTNSLFVCFWFAALGESQSQACARRGMVELTTLFIESQRVENHVDT